MFPSSSNTLIDIFMVFMAIAVVLCVRFARERGRSGFFWFIIAISLTPVGAYILLKILKDKTALECPECGNIIPYKTVDKSKGEYTSSQRVNTTQRKSDGTRDGRYQSTGYTASAYNTYKVECTKCEHNFTFKEYDYSGLGFIEKSIRARRDRRTEELHKSFAKTGRDMKDFDDAMEWIDKQ